MYAGDPMNRRVAALLSWAVCATWGLRSPASGFRSRRHKLFPHRRHSVHQTRCAWTRGRFARRAHPRPSSTRWARASFGYFRTLARQFDARTCYEFRDLRWRLPSVAVHGDAHIEQFAITDTLYGLTDFDRSGFGPSVVDLVRYSASIHLAAVKCSGGAIPDRR